MKKPEYLRGKVFCVFLFFVIPFFDSVLISVRNHRFVFLSLCFEFDSGGGDRYMCRTLQPFRVFAFFGRFRFRFGADFGPKSSICRPLALSSESDSGGGDRYMCRTLRPFRVFDFFGRFRFRFGALSFRSEFVDFSSSRSVFRVRFWWW